MDERVVRWRVSTREGKLSSSREGERETNEQSTDGPVVDPFPVPSFSQEVLMSALEESLDLGLTKAVGVSNYNKEQLEKARYFR